MKWDVQHYLKDKKRKEKIKIIIIKINQMKKKISKLIIKFFVMKTLQHVFFSQGNEQTF